MARTAATCQLRAGDLIAAGDAYAALLDDQARVLGARDPATVLTFCRFTELQGGMGNATAAADGLAWLVESCADRSGSGARP